MQRKVLLYDKGGEEHFNLISALHKSVRSSDADAALYWLARMLEAGEDRLYIARRLVRMAIEDIGLADPRALEQAVAAMQAVHFLGIPEGDLALAQAAIYLCVAPKSDAAYRAMARSRRTWRRPSPSPCPMHLRNAPTRLMKAVGLRRGLSARAQVRGRHSRYGMPAAFAGRAALLLPHRPRLGEADWREAGGDSKAERENVDYAFQTAPQSRGAAEPRSETWSNKSVWHFVRLAFPGLSACSPRFRVSAINPKLTHFMWPTSWHSASN